MERFGDELPEELANPPELEPHLLLYYQAFYDLDSERNHSMGPMPIPWSAIVRYATYYRFDSIQVENLIFYIRRMDEFHLKRVSENMKSKE